jgi:DNA-binding transcriptional ArsR family regulator
MVAQPKPIIDFVPADEFVVDNLDTLKVLADPLRIRMLDLMREPCTVKQVANEIKIPPTKLYYHITQLEKHGLIILVDTRIVSGIIEKHYQTVAHSLRVKRQLLSPSPDNNDVSGLDITVSSLWQDVIDDLRESASLGIIDTSGDEDKVNPATLNLRNSDLALSPEQATEFLTRYRALVEEFRGISDQQMTQPDINMYRLFTVLFPSARKPYPNTKHNSDE